MAKKTPTMLKRMKKKLKKEDIMKYGTKEEIKQLLEADDPFEIPVGDEQDQSLPEDEMPLEDEQESGNYESELGLKTITVPEDLAERLYVFITDAKEGDPEEREDLLGELESLLGPLPDPAEAVDAMDEGEDEIEQTSNRGQDDGEVTLDNDFFEEE